MFRDESIGARSACIHFWRVGISAPAMQALALAMLAVLPPIATAELPVSDPNEVRAKLPISHDTPNEWIVARVGSGNQSRRFQRVRTSDDREAWRRSDYGAT